MTIAIETNISCLFVDIGGVLLSDGWGHKSRELAAKTFELNGEEMELRHHQIFEAYEMGKFSLDEYLNQVVFYQPRPFSQEEFRQFIFRQSTPNIQMLELIHTIKTKYELKVVAVSNEARELNEYRISTFKLNLIFDFFISSCFVHLRKPDPAIFKLALDVAQVPVKQILYIENSPEFIPVAGELGIQSILHVDYHATCSQLEWFGLQTEETRLETSELDDHLVAH